MYHQKNINMILNELITILQKTAPLLLQESYDNSGLLIGSRNNKINKALICLDVTEAVVDEAISCNCDVIIAHHPIIFKGLKKITGDNSIERIVKSTIKNDISVYAIHTNLDNVLDGVNGILAKKLGLINTRILQPGIGKMFKVVTFCPTNDSKSVQEAMFKNGAGEIGNYSSCSYLSEGTGTFMPLDGSHPHVGIKGELHNEPEIKIESVVAEHNLNKTINALIKAHPYEVPAYDVIPLHNSNPEIGAGIIGELPESMEITSYLKKVKNTLNCEYIKHNKLIKHHVKRVAICGGSGSSLIDAAARNNADVFITGDIKYHDFFEHTGKMTLADAGHFETEHPVKELIYALLKENFPNFALQISKSNANPVSFL